nr:nitroreductase [Streptomyces otsuchiensis]
MHNAQPWSFHYSRDSRTVALHADLTRTMPLADPVDRGLHLGCGAALLNLRVAAAHAGLSPATTLLPEPPEVPPLLATVRLGPGGHRGEPGGEDGGEDGGEGVGEGDGGDGGEAGRREDAADAPQPALRDLHPAIHARHTSRHPFADRPVPAGLRAALGEAARREGADLTFLTGPHLQVVLDLTRDAEGYDHMDAAREEERRRWTRQATTGEPSGGIPDAALGPAKSGGAGPARDFAASEPVPGRVRAEFERRPQLALLVTRGDHPADWLRAGQALERVLLLATLNGLSTSFATQALEWPDLRWLLRDPLSGAGHVQMVLRLGYGPDGSGAPRRPVEEVLSVGD